MAVLKWLSLGNRMPYGIIHVHHNTGAYADKALEFISTSYQDYCLDLFVKKVKGHPPKGTSKEAWWRQKRYALFQEVLDETNKQYPIILAHNLDDCVEQFVMSTLIRFSKSTIIPYYGPSFTIRPFRTWKKTEIIRYATKHNLQWIEDPSNKDTRYLRNKVRHEIIPKLLEVNPGLYNHVKTLVMEETDKWKQDL